MVALLIILRNLSLTVFLLFCFSSVCYATDTPQLSASSAILIDGDTLEILYDKNADEKRSMASTTKIMTSLIAVESEKLQKTVKVKNDCVQCKEKDEIIKNLNEYINVLKNK